MIATVINEKKENNAGSSNMHTPQLSNGDERLSKFKQSAETVVHVGQFSGTVLHARQVSIKRKHRNQFESPLF